MKPPFEFLGPYRVGEPLGRGGMGTVYAAVHEKTGERVAVKLIAPQVADEPRFRRRFDSEIKSLERLRHDGIVRIIGFGEEEGQLFYSMELVEGESLQARLRRVKRMDWRPTLDISIQICAALKHAHDIGVIHRDLKPANLLLTNDDTVKIVDFGIAKIFGGGENTSVGSVLGTADYMAPEQATSRGITQRTDLYVLGSVMYTMLAGRAPFTGNGLTEVMASLQRDRPVPLDLVRPELPGELVELIHQLLEKDPNDRPPTALSVMNRLKAMRAGLGRAQTVLVDGSPTKVGPKQVEESDTSLTGLQGHSDSMTNEVESGSAQEQPPPSEKPARSRDSKNSLVPVDPNHATVVAVEGTDRTKLPDGSLPSNSKDGDSNDKASKTHFQTVNEKERGSGHFGRTDSAESAGTSWLTITLMVLVLLGGAGLFVYAMRPPTADMLYETAVAGDTGSMTTFLRRFPEDGRAGEIRDLQTSGRLNGVLRRLQTQSQLSVTPLKGAEDGFLSAMESRDLEPQHAIERIQQWLNVYDTEQNQSDETIQELIQLAKYEQKLLADRKPLSLTDPRARELLNDIRDVVKTENRETIQKRLTGIIETFQDKPWAAPAVTEAQRQLAEQASLP